MHVMARTENTESTKNVRIPTKLLELVDAMATETFRTRAGMVREILTRAVGGVSAAPTIKAIAIPVAAVAATPARSGEPQICTGCRAGDCAVCVKVKTFQGREIFRCQCQVCGGAVPVAVVESVAPVGSAE